MEILIAVVCGYILDLIFGDPVWLYHPIRLIGLLISKLEAFIRKTLPKTNNAQLLGGVIINIATLSCCYLAPFYLLLVAFKVSPVLKLVIETFFCYQIFATKSLKKESMRVYKYVAENDIENSRKYLSWIVGRDTQNLTFVQIIKAVIETVAENTVDGVIAPLCFMLIGGAPLGFLYKGVNTLDSMIGYKNEKYLYFGRFSARVDDVFNFIPAILSAWIMIFSSMLLKYNYKNAVKIYKRDRKNHASPNSAKTESVAAGALEIQLAGNAYYFGKLYEKPNIGDNLREIEAFDIVKINRLMYVTSSVAVIIFSLVRLAVIIL